MFSMREPIQKPLGRRLRLPEENEGFFASVGLHPEDIYEISDIEAAFAEIKALASHKKAVAIGEIGLDYHWHGENRELQKYWFSRQLALAEELGASRYRTR